MTLDQILRSFTGAGITIRKMGSCDIKIVQSINVDARMNKLTLFTSDDRHSFDLRKDFGDHAWTMQIENMSGEKIEISFRSGLVIANRRADWESLLRQDLRLCALRDAMGYVQNGSNTTVKISQDDATRAFHLSTGEGGHNQYYSDSLDGLLDQLILRMDRSQD